jgi:hypothetical protein
MNAMQRIELKPQQGTMAFSVRSPVFPEGAVAVTAPETIGDVDDVLLNFPGFEPQWSGPDEAGVVGYRIGNEKVRVEVRAVPFCDHVDLWQGITNLTSGTLRHAFAFTCVNPGPVADKPGERTYLDTAKGPTRIADMRLTPSPRPLQIYMLQQSQHQGLRFVNAFKATCETPAADSWIATVAADGRRVVGVAAEQAAFLFNNAEYGCIHSAPDFGDVPPGETRWALTRVYLIPGDLGTFIKRQAHDRQGLVPSLRAVTRDPAAIGFQAAEVWLPWADAGHLTLRFPETLASNLGLLFIDHVRADMPPVVRAASLPDWRCDCATGALWYRLRLPNDVSFGARITPTAGGAALSFRVKNATGASLKSLVPQFCLVEDGAAPFSCGDLSRTYVRSSDRWLSLAETLHQVMDARLAPWVIAGVREKGPRSGASMAGAWYVCRERADVPLIATTDAAGARVIGLTWEGGRSVMSNGRIPCLHADPVIADAAPGETVVVRGRIFVVSEGLDALWREYRATSRK